MATRGVKKALVRQLMSPPVDKPATPTYYFPIMASERIQRQINLLLDQIEEEASQLNWAAVRERAQAVLAYDPENSDGLAFLATAE